MDNVFGDTSEQDLERLFQEARDYPLLSAEEERSADAAKWAAVDGMQQAMLSDTAGRRWLLAWVDACRAGLLDISWFPNRELHFVLRREIVDFLPDGKARSEADRFAVAAATVPYDADAVAAALRELELPASLTVGLAVCLLRLAGKSYPDTVADALLAWRDRWEVVGSRPGKGASSGLCTTLERELTRYKRARDKLTMHNLRLVYSIAGRHRGRGVGYLDLIQEGTLGLIRAAEKYQYRRGFRFSTYCFNWITQAIRRHVGDSGTLIRYPTHVQDQVNKLYRIKINEAQRTGVEPRDEDLAEAAGFTVDKTRTLLQLRNLGVSLDAPQYDDEEGSLLDTLPGGPFESTESTAETDSLHERLLKEMRDLEPAERQVVIARWGLHEGPPLSRAEIADRMAVSREWVRQLERSALAKLSRKPAVRDAYRDYSALT